MMPCRINELLCAIKANPGHLTQCLKSAVEFAPQSLLWNEISYDSATNTACFEAVSDGGMLYSINVLDGTILVNGLPPDILPSSLTSKPIYGRTFGKRNFEITTVHAGYYRTARQVDGGYFYGFKVINNSLHIFEDKSPDLNGSELLLLLDRSSLEIPTILREENSHWYSKASDAVLFRPIYYERRQVKYVMTHDDTFEVPIEKQDSSLDDILIERTRMPCLLIGETSTSKLLERFEHKEFVHIFRNAESTCVRYWLPRFSLGFHQTNEGIHSSNFKSYVLKEKQIMEDTLKGFFCYLLLSDARKSGGSDIVLIPSGQLSPEGSIKKPTSWDVPIGYHIFNRHPRFKHLIAKDTTGRLQLAGLYMAHSSLLNEPLNGKSGFITATNLVRQCWSNEPLNSVVREKLNEITNLKTSNMYSPMKLMCTFLWRSSNSLGFLYSGDANLSNEEGNFWLDNLAVRDYKSNSHVPRLLASEELALLGNYLPRCSHIPLQKPSAHLRTTETFIRSTESALGNEFVLKLELRAVESGFPLTVPTAASGIEKKVFDNLLSSWQKFIELEEYFVLFEEGLCGAFLGKTTERREMLERAILLSLKTPLSSDHLVSKLSGRIPECAAFDLLGMAWDEGQIKVVNPYLKGTQSAMELRQQIINWMCLCVLEDKLSRLPSAVATPATLKEELLCRRNWNVWEHPKWLAFEVEHCLQIRPCQYNIVKQLLDSPDSPGSVIQLNMGLGKTSVLVPMLVLELSQRGTDIVRINSLASIIHVVVNKYRSMLTSSVHNIKIFTLPFDRNKPLEACHADAITDELKYCLEGYGCFVVSPQHRNSLLLKQYDENIFVKGLRENSFYDILDESDEILSHVFQLVYAIGEQKPLPNGPSRWTVIEAFFKVLVRSELSAVNSIISNPELAHKEAVCAGSFPKLHFLSSFEAVQCDLGATLSNEFIRLAPYELEWMKHLSDEQTKSLVSIISDITYDAAKAIDADPVFANHEADILVARGCIAYGLLFHALQSRYRVEYGLSPSLGKRMAIPYEASDTPKLRSEFCHPDMAIIYTFLSYFQDGIERCHLKEALECLKCRNPTASEKIYSEWIENIRKDVSPSILQSFDVFSKVDTDNASQFNLMYKFLKYSMDVISFWLNNFVCPDETAQFDSKRITSAWNLADSSRRSNGFSGTDDNRFLLPFGVQQISPADNSLMATNAYMINCILDCTDKDLIILEDKESRPLWESLLRSCLLPGIHALIDVGGLMAGLPNEKAALFLSDIGLSEGFRGIVYYDVLSQGWNVYERKEMRHLPLGQSSFQEAECFVYFDESRCRGSDMKLKPMACGLVTLVSYFLCFHVVIILCLIPYRLLPSLSHASVTCPTGAWSHQRQVPTRLCPNEVPSQERPVHQAHWYARSVEFQKYRQRCPRTDYCEYY